MNSYDSAKQNCQLCYQIYARDLLMFNQTLIDKPPPPTTSAHLKPPKMFKMQTYTKKWTQLLIALKS